jgi:TonB-dependent starch-binding outer membrane protein SusC
MRKLKLLKLTTYVVTFLLLINQVFAQTKTVTGTVTDQAGKGVPGVTVTVKGSNVSTQTDANGTYRINASDNATLVFSSIGFGTMELQVSGRSSVDASLTATADNLSEVVVIGYGTTRKKDLTGSVASVGEKNFNRGVYTSPDQLIQGKVAGVLIINNSGQPGGATTVKIRGNSAITGTGQPLYVVDGVPLDGRSPRPDIGDFGFGDSGPSANPLNFINPADIASMDVLKDASATAIYGSRAAFGVILITTKKGTSGQTKIDVGASVGTSSTMRRIEVLNASQFKEALAYYGEPTTHDKGGDVDAYDEITQRGLIQNYNIAISGGNENSKYRFSLGALDQEGIIRKSGFKKYTAYLNGQFRFLENKNLGLDVSLLPSHQTEDITPISNNAGAEGSMIGQALQWNPTLPLVVKRANGSDSIVNVGGTSIINPLGLSEAYNDQAKINTILASISPYFKFTSWLEYRFLYSIYYGSGVRRTTMAPDINVARSQGKGLAQIGEAELSTQQFTHTLSFNKEIANGLNLNAVIGYEYLDYTNKGFSMFSEGPSIPGGFGNYGLNYTNYIQFGNPTNRVIESFVDPTNELQSYFARTIFNLRDKYLLTATIRADGSTKFGENSKYGYYPSLAGAWVISKEDFFHLGFMNSLKFRAGWGKTGNQEFPSGAAIERFGLGANGSINPVNAFNQDLGWQSDRQYNIGLDMSLVNSRITLTADYFNKRTTDLLFPSAPAQPAAPGAPIRWINLPGKIDNSGFEVSVNASILREADLNWDFGVNASFLKNNVSELTASIPTGLLSGQGVSNTSVQLIANGLPINSFVTREFLGMDKATGQAIYRDEGNTFFYVGDPNPNTLLGISTTLNYKKLTVTANMNGSFGHSLYNNTLNNVINVGNLKGGRNIGLSVFQDPVKESFANPVTASSRFIEKGNYLKMANASISYAIGNITSHLKGANIFLTGQNLFVITKFSGFDPEVNVDKNIQGVPSLGIEYIPYPSARTITLGVNFSL